MFLWVFVVALILTAGRQVWVVVRTAARHDLVHNNLKQLLLGLHNFNDVYKHLPPSTITSNGIRPHDADHRSDNPPLHSWRFVICPLLESQHWGSNDFSKPWNDPQYAQWNATPLWVYCDQALNTRFVAITGPDTAWGDGTKSPRNIEYLPSDLILIVETRKSGLHWMQPGDFDIRTLPRTINARDGSGISSDDPAGVFVGLADASVRFVPSDLPFEKLEPFFTITGAAANDIDEVLP